MRTNTTSTPSSIAFTLSSKRLTLSLPSMTMVPQQHPLTLAHKSIRHLVLTIARTHPHENHLTSATMKFLQIYLGQILRKVQAYIEKKKKIVVNINTIKEQLIIFLRSDIENPNFDSQTKECMNTPSNKFGSTCTVSDEFAEKVATFGISVHTNMPSRSATS